MKVDNKYYIYCLVIIELLVNLPSIYILYNIWSLPMFCSDIIAWALIGSAFFLFRSIIFIPLIFLKEIISWIGHSKRYSYTPDHIIFGNFFLEKFYQYYFKVNFNKNVNIEIDQEELSLVIINDRRWTVSPQMAERGDSRSFVYVSLNEVDDKPEYYRFYDKTVMSLIINIIMIENPALSILQRIKKAKYD